MKKTQFSQAADEARKKKIIFYTALGICLAAIGIALYIGISQTVREINEDRTIDLEGASSRITAVQEESEPPAEEAGQDDVEAAVEPKPAGTEAEETPKQTEQPKPLSFALPLEGEVLQPFSNHELVKSVTLNEWRTHDGVDLKAAADTPVKAIADGTVEEISEDPMWGITVTVSHREGYQSLYCGLKPNVPVKKGAEVSIGEVLGYVGNTAEIEIAEDSHLHLAVRQNDEWIDPMSLMQ